MELFKLFGTIAVKNEEANRDIDETTNKAEQSEGRISGAFKKIGKSIVDAFSKNKNIKDTESNLNELTKTINSQEGDLSKLKSKYSDLYLTQGKNSDEAKKTAQEIDKLSKELKENKSALSEAEKAADSFDNSLEDVGDSAGNSGGKIIDTFKKIGGAVVTYLAVDKIVEFGKSITNAAAEVAAEQSAFEQIMGDYSNTAQEKVNEIADATGMVDTRLTPYMTSMTAKFKGLGFDIGDATTLAQDGLTLAADAAAFWDKSLEDSMSGLNSFINGSYEGGEAIGLFANDTQLASYAVKNGIVSETKEWANLDEARKQATRLQYAQDMMKASGATGQAAKEANQYANVQANLTEKWRQFKAQIGEPLLQNIVIPAMEKLSGVVDVASGKFQQLQTWVSENQQTIQIVAGVVAVAAAAILGYNAAVTAMSIVQKATAWVKGLNIAFAANPIGLVVAAIAALVTAFILLWNNCEGFREFWINLWEIIKSAALAAWNAIKEFASSAVETITNIWTSVTEFFSNLWSSITDIASTAWETIKNVVTVGVMLIGEIISAAVQIITLPWQFIWQNCSQYIIAAWEAIKSAVSTAINFVSNTIKTVFNAVSSFINTVWNGIKTAITAYLNSVKAVNTTIWNAIKAVITTVLNAIKSVVTTVWNAISSMTSSVFNTIKSVATSIWNGIKATIQSAVNNVQSVVSSVWNSIKSTTSSVFNSIKSTASSVWNGIKSAIQTPINAAKDAVKSAIDKMKSFFNFSWSLPKLKLPHISISGKFSINPPSVPKFGIEWYKKGGIMEDPTLFGINQITGRAMVGGEAGPEAIAPIDKLQDYVMAAVRAENGEVSDRLDRLIRILEKYFPLILAKMAKDIYLDSGELVGSLGGKMDAELGDIAALRRRGQ